MNTTPITDPVMREDFHTDFDAWFSAFAADVKTQDQSIDIANRLLIAAARLAFREEATKVAVFKHAEAFGVHFMPVHFYHPTPDTKTLPDSTWKLRYDGIPGLQIDDARIIGLLDRLTEFGGELHDVPEEGPGFAWTSMSESLSRGDASLLYGMIRACQPNRVIEIGSGRSTHVGLKAFEANGKGAYICIEPYPNETVRKLTQDGRITLIEDIVQNVGLDVFEQLEKDDILFIDSTHVAQIGSDVTYEILQILPRLKPGVLVHVHDIFLPYEVSEDWVKNKLLFWNEQHLLAAFMAFNSDFEMLLPNQYLGRAGDAVQAAAQKAFPFCQDLGGGSFWLQRRA